MHSDVGALAVSDPIRLPRQSCKRCSGRTVGVGAADCDGFCAVTCEICGGLIGLVHASAVPPGILRRDLGPSAIAAAAGPTKEA